MKTGAPFTSNCNFVLFCLDLWSSNMVAYLISVDAYLMAYLGWKCATCIAKFKFFIGSVKVCLFLVFHGVV